MPVYEIESGGTTFEVEAPDIRRAQSAARLMIARQRMVGQAEAGAEERSAPARANERFLEAARGSLERAGTFGAAPTQEDVKAGREQNIAGLTLGAMALPATAGALVAAPATALKALGGGIVGSAVGSEAGQWVGHRVPIIGGETAGKVLGTVGGLVGGGVGASVGPKVAARQLANALTGGRFSSLLGTAESKVAAPISEATKQSLAHDAERLLLKRRALELAEKRFAEQVANKAQKVAARTGRPVAVQAETAAAPAPASAAPVVVPATTGVPVTAAPEETIILKLQQEMKTASGRKVVREYLNSLPKEAASRIRLLLARGQAHPATVAGGGARSGGSVPSARERGLGAELARMLGQ